jgi:hypothetical protein
MYGSFAGDCNPDNTQEVLQIVEYAMDRFSSDNTETSLTPEQMFGMLELAHDTIRKLALTLRNVQDGRSDLNQ